MKRIPLFMLSLTMLFLLSGCDTAAPSPSEEAVALRYDGMYCYIWDFDNNGLTNNYALRFYEDGTVIHTSVEQKKAGGTYFPDESWFNREDDYYKELLGHYELSGGGITLTTYSPQGSVDYKGTVYSNKLVLDSHSNINGHEVKGSQYVFYPFGEAHK